MNKGYGIHDSENIFIKPSERESYKFKYSANIKQKMTTDDNIVSNIPILPIESNIHVIAIEPNISNEQPNPINVYPPRRPIKPKRHATKLRKWREWTKYEKAMDQYRLDWEAYNSIFYVNYCIFDRNNYMFDNLDNNIISIGHDDVSLQTANRNLELFRTNPGTFITWTPPMTKDECLIKEQTRIEQLRAVKIHDTINPSIEEGDCLSLIHI